MNVPQEELNEWADRLFKANGLLLSAMTAGYHGDAKSAGEYAGMVQERLNGLRQAMVRAGADDPMEAAQAELYEQCRAAGMPVPEHKEVPLEVLCSPTAQEYARVMRRAADLAELVDKERGYWPDGPAERVDDWADYVEFEVFGPKGLPGIE
jgi:hypothetical protein